MRPKSIILIAIALGCGLVASIGISQAIQQEPQSQPAMETQKIFVALSAVDIGERLTAQNVRLEEWPKDRVPQGALIRLEDIQDRFPRQRLYEGEPILSAKLMDSLESDAMKIPEGYRVVSVKVTMDTSVSGLIRPGDRVDVLVFLRRTAEVQQTGVRTILKDARVFAVNQETERSVDLDGKPLAARTVSLLVEPQQVERLMLAGQLGTLQLSLRRPDDKQEVATTGTTIDQLFGTYTERAEVIATAGGAALGQASGLLDWLKQRGEKPEEYREPVAAQPADGWKMFIHTPEGHTQYQWDQASGMPSVQAGGSLTGVPSGGEPQAGDQSAAAPELGELDFSESWSAWERMQGPAQRN